MADEIARLVRDLPGMSDLSEVSRLAKQWLAAGDAARVAELGLAFAREYGGRESEPGPYRAVRHMLVQLLALKPGPGRAVLTAHLVEAFGADPRWAASLLATADRAADLAELFQPGTGGPQELRACLVQELVVRDVDLAELPGATEWAAAFGRSGHPLAWLPIDRAAFERARPLPERFPNGELWRVPIPEDTTPALPAVRETTTAATSALIAAAARHWCEESNGEAEVKEFEFAAALPATALPAALQNLGLESPTDAYRVSISRCYPQEVWWQLFDAASERGAYSEGEYGAYGRLAAWRSLAGLVGAGEGASAAEVEALVAAHRWYSFWVEGGWYAGVQFRLAIVALSPGDRRLAVLAAADAY